MTMDLNSTRRDTVKNLIEAIAQNVLGIETPESVPAVNEPNNKKLAFDIVTSFMTKLTKN